MNSVKRVYVEKKPEFAVQAKELGHEVKSYLGIKSVTNSGFFATYTSFTLFIISSIS